MMQYRKISRGNAEKCDQTSTALHLVAINTIYDTASFCAVILTTTKQQPPSSFIDYILQIHGVHPLQQTFMHVISYRYYGASINGAGNYVRTCTNPRCVRAKTYTKYVQTTYQPTAHKGCTFPKRAQEELYFLSLSKSLLSVADNFIRKQLRLF